MATSSPVSGTMKRDIGALAVSRYLSSKRHRTKTRYSKLTFGQCPFCQEEIEPFDHAMTCSNHAAHLSCLTTYAFIGDFDAPTTREGLEPPFPFCRRVVACPQCRSLVGAAHATNTGLRTLDPPVALRIVLDSASEGQTVCRINGCTFEGSASVMRDHTRACPSFKFPCPNRGCESQVSLATWPAHAENDCGNFLFHCGCMQGAATGPPADLAAHSRAHGCADTTIQELDGRGIPLTDWELKFLSAMHRELEHGRPNIDSDEDESDSASDEDDAGP
jgi:hypothetical protein